MLFPHPGRRPGLCGIADKNGNDEQQSARRIFRRAVCFWNNGGSNEPDGLIFTQERRR